MSDKDEGCRINEVREGGRYVTLDDGSEWEISPMDTASTAQWLPMTEITVTAGAGAPGYDHTLTNEDDNETAAAKRVRGA